MIPGCEVERAAHDLDVGRVAEEQLAAGERPVAPVGDPRHVGARRRQDLARHVDRAHFLDLVLETDIEHGRAALLRLRQAGFRRIDGLQARLRQVGACVVDSRLVESRWGNLRLQLGRESRRRRDHLDQEDGDPGRNDDNHGNGE